MKYSIRQIHGFTLTETLVTLGIIGVIAVMTLPSLITNYKVRVLKVQFEKADYTITQALKNTGLESGYDIEALYIPGVNPGSNENNKNDFKKQLDSINPYWRQQFTSLTPLTYSFLFHKGITCKNLLGDREASGAGCYTMSGTPYILNDGLLISDLSVHHGGGGNPILIQMVFDTNGPFKGPNRWGHDIFLYMNYDYPARRLCNPTIRHSETNKYCYFFAHENSSPVNSSKSYWDILYKSKSWWEKQSNK